MSDIQFPTIRQQYSGIGNPRYVSDIQEANQMVLDAISALGGFGSSDFAILAGFNYVVVVSGVNYYTPGVFFLNGVWYYQATDFNEGQYLGPNVTGIMPFTYPDAVIRNQYVVNYGIAVNSYSPSTSPQFMGNMNAYRYSNKFLAQTLSSVQFQVALQNVQVATIVTSYTLFFTNDQAIFVAAATNTFYFTFDIVAPIPGTVITVKFDMNGGQSLGVIDPAGTISYLESGNLADAPGTLNIMYFIYVGINETGLKEFRYSIVQV